MYSAKPIEGPKRARTRVKSREKPRQISKSQTAKVFKDFCESTSLHGYPYLFIANSIILRILWIIIIIAFTCVGIGFLISNTDDYLSSNIVTTIDTSSAPLTVSLVESIKNLVKI